MLSKICATLLAGSMLASAPSTTVGVKPAEKFKPASAYQLVAANKVSTDFELQEAAKLIAESLPQEECPTDPFKTTNLSAEQFNKILLGTGLEGQGEAYFKVEREYGVNGMFAIGVAFLESGFGKYKANTNNYYGMRTGKGYMSFSSPAENILYFGKLMNKNLYKGKSMPQIARIYCPPNHKNWVSSVRSIMGSYYDKAFS